MTQNYASDNSVEIIIFPDYSENITTDEDNLIKEINSLVKSLSEDYLWHADKLKFEITSGGNISYTSNYEKDSLPPHLYTNVYFGENVEDEWFIVYILLEITKHIDGIIVRVWDSDGEFLLIEAAEYLPQWCNPESCSGRVFLYKGCVHLVKKESTDTDTINLSSVLNKIRSGGGETKADEDVQNAMLNKVRGYPDKINEQIHYAHIYVPVSVAKVLKVYPNFISNATRAFCHRDALDIKAVKNLPNFSKDSKIMQRIKFTKCLYAMLMSSQFVHPTIPVSSSLDYKPRSIGTKLMFGFEILLSQVQDINNKFDSQWEQYLQSLKSKNYFKDLLEGSKEYNELEGMAREFYLKNRNEDVSSRGVGHDILYVIKDDSVMLDCDAPLLPPDDDSWMLISSEDLDKMLKEKFQFRTENSGIESGAGMTSAFNKFLNHTSGVEGAEFPQKNENGNILHEDDEADSSDEISPHTSNEKKVRFEGISCLMDSEDMSDIEFNLEDFSSAINKVLDTLEHPDEDESGESDFECGSDSDDYMKAMEQELSETTMAQSFVKKDDDSVDIDMNALRNVIESYEAQIGSSGPASNVLNPMGINIRAILEERTKK